MRYAATERLAMYAAAQRGLATLESDAKLQIKYADFIDEYAGLSEAELLSYQQDYASKDEVIMGFTQILLQKGRQEGRQEGHQEGQKLGREQGLKEECLNLVTRLLRHKLANHPANQTQLEAALDELAGFPTERLEELAEALLDFDDMSDLRAWLNTHRS